MNCSISGEVPKVPAVSKNSGLLFEKRLIERHISDYGKCPITGKPLTMEDIVPIKGAKIVKPRPVQAASIPGMLGMFQIEWDSLMLSNFALEQQLHTARQELSHALYQHDAACRVIARLKQERDEALPKGIKIANLPEFDGTKDPQDHLDKFYAKADLYDIGDAAYCKIFRTTLAGRALSWFNKLPPGTIGSLEQLTQHFLHQFSINKKYPKTAAYLFTIMQKEGESLREYVQRFTQAVRIIVARHYHIGPV